MLHRTVFNIFRHTSTTQTLSRPKTLFIRRTRTFPYAYTYSTNSNSSSFKRRWGRDEILALSTWLLVGTGAFVLVGTTTSASLALLLANSLQFQGKLGN